jgi:hypothetical protein
MEGREAELTALRERADREIAIASEAYRGLVAVARRQLANGKGAADLWALMTTQTALEFGCTTKRQQFAVEILFAAVIEAARDGE